MMVTQPDQIRAHIEALFLFLGQSTKQVFDIALSIDEGAGTSPQWQSLCAHYGAVLITEEERLQIRAMQKPLLGAPLLEVSRVLECITRSVRVEVNKINVFDQPTSIEQLHTRILQLASRIDTELLNTYRTLVLPKRKSMFDNVLVHHSTANSSKNQWHDPKAHTFRCQNCGAPRFQEAEVHCAFCNQPMFKNQ